jgi:hypothetical protein
LEIALPLVDKNKPIATTMTTKISDNRGYVPNKQAKKPSVSGKIGSKENQCGWKAARQPWSASTTTSPHIF